VRGNIYDLGYILTVIAFTAYGQIVLKWRVSQFGSMPEDVEGKLRFVVGSLFDPFIASGLAAAVIASLAWIAAMTRMDLSYAYPFLSINFVVVMVLSAWLLDEPLNGGRVAGVCLIMLGTILVSRS
jgi:drug/metabolite transporter (DMT)-like permease